MYTHVCLLFVVPLFVYLFDMHTYMEVSKNEDTPVFLFSLSRCPSLSLSPSVRPSVPPSFPPSLPHSLPCICMCVYACMCVCIYIYTCIHVYVYVDISTHTRVDFVWSFIYIYIYIHTYKYIYIYIYTHTHTHIYTPGYLLILKHYLFLFIVFRTWFVVYVGLCGVVSVCGCGSLLL